MECNQRDKLIDNLFDAIQSWGTAVHACERLSQLELSDANAKADAAPVLCEQRRAELLRHQHEHGGGAALFPLRSENNVIHQTQRRFIRLEL